MNSTHPWLALLVLALLGPAHATAQPARAEHVRQILDEAQAHRREGRHALAAERFLALHQAMRDAALPRAPVALWSAGRALSQVPGRERDAIRVLRQFLDESVTLTEDTQVSDWRSRSIGLIDELEARAPEPEPTTGEAEPPGPAAREQRVSPIGPVILGVGGAVLATGVIIGAFSLGQASEFRDACSDLTMCPTRLRAQYDEMRTYSMVADVLMVAGGAIAIAGLVLTFVLTEDVDAQASAACTSQGCLAFVRGSF